MAHVSVSPTSQAAPSDSDSEAPRAPVQSEQAGPSEEPGVSEEPGALPPKRFGQRYSVHRELGTGASGTTYLVWDLLHDGSPLLVALKQFKDKDTILCAREAWFLQQLNHSQIPKYINHFWDEGTQSWCLVMEVVPGKPLSAFDRTSFSNEVLTVILVKQLDILIVLRAHGITHRDIHPGNVMLDINPTTGNLDVHLLDFNMASHETENCCDLISNVPICYVNFAPPEASLFLSTIDPFMAAAIIAYFCNPDKSNKFFAYWASRDWVPKTPLEHVLKKALDWEPNNRYPSLEAFRSALLATISELGRLIARPSDYPEFGVSPEELHHLTALFLREESMQVRSPRSEAEPGAVPVASAQPDSDPGVASVPPVDHPAGPQPQCAFPPPSLVAILEAMSIVVPPYLPLSLLLPVTLALAAQLLDRPGALSASSTTPGASIPQPGTPPASSDLPRPIRRAPSHLRSAAGIALAVTTAALPGAAILTVPIKLAVLAADHLAVSESVQVVAEQMKENVRNVHDNIHGVVESTVNEFRKSGVPKVQKVAGTIADFFRGKFS